jgi:hypothetical protein
MKWSPCPATLNLSRFDLSDTEKILVALFSITITPLELRSEHRTRFLPSPTAGSILAGYPRFLEEEKHPKYPI